MPGNVLRVGLLKRGLLSITIELNRESVYQEKRGPVAIEIATGPRLFYELFSGRACTPLCTF